MAPAPIRTEVVALVGRIEHQSLPTALATFGAEVAHPSADLVVAALSIAARMEASDMTGLLSRLAEAIRGEARMRIRVEVGRTRVRTATRVIAGVVAASIVLLTVLNRSYLVAYDSPSGQLVLVAIGGIFALGGWLLLRMAELAASIALAGSQGERIRASLAAKADSLRGHQVAETESSAEAATERMTIPVAVLLFGFSVFVAYPAVHQITTVSTHRLP